MYISDLEYCVSSSCGCNVLITRASSQRNDKETQYFKNNITMINITLYLSINSRTAFHFLCLNSEKKRGNSARKKRKEKNFILYIWLKRKKIVYVFDQNNS